jgi:hypothetical protein
VLGWARLFLSDPRTPLAAAAFVVAALAAAWPLARLLRWSRWLTVATLLSAAAIATLTLPPAPGAPVLGPAAATLRACAGSLVDPGSLRTAFDFAAGRGERVGNIVMFVPLAFFAALASRRPVLAGAVAAAAPVLIELTQAMTGAGRTCYGYDWVDNATGALLGALGAAVLLALLRARRARAAGALTSAS